MGPENETTPSGGSGWMRRLGVVIAGLSYSLAPVAATPDTLTLEAAIALGRAQAAEVAEAAARQQATGARLAGARAARRPTLTLSEVWIRTDSPADVFGLQLNQERFSFPDFVASDPNDPDPLESATTRLELSLPIYTGGELARRIEQAELAWRSSAESHRRTADVAAFAAGEAYLGLLQARRHVALLERALATVEAHAALAEAYVDQGMLVRSERLRAEVERARLADELAAAEGRAGVAEAALSFRIGAPLGSSWRLATVGEPPPTEGDLAEWVARSGSRADLVAARALLAAAELEERALRGRRRPRVGLTARYDLVDDEPFGTGGDSTTLLAAASLDLFAGGRHRAARAAARAEAEAAALGVERLAEGIRLEVRQAFTQSTIAHRRLSTTREALAVAREGERITTERFRQGVVRMIDLLDATTARTEAGTRHIVAQADAHLAALRLALAAGLRPESLGDDGRSAAPETASPPSADPPTPPHGDQDR